MPTRLHAKTKELIEASKEPPPPITAQNAESSLAKLADAATSIAQFLQGGGLINALQGYVRAQAVSSILNGLIAKDGRTGLDARTMKQNAIDSVAMIETYFKHYQERLTAMQSGEHSGEVKDPTSELEEWLKKREG